MGKVDEIRDRIIDVAQRIFSRFGFDKTTMEVIAKEAGKGKSTLYYYFKNKEELYAAVIEKEGNYIMSELMKVINSGGDTKTLFTKYAKKRFELIEKVANYYSLVKDEYLKYYSFVQKYRQKHDEFELLALKQMLLRGIEKGELIISEKEVDDYAIGIATAMKGLEIPLLIDSSSNTMEKKIDILLQLFFYGILKR